MNQPLILPEEMNDDLREVLGRPCFACGQLASLLRSSGEEIPRKAEAEQASVVFWLLKLVLRHGSLWRDAAADEMKTMMDAVAKRDAGPGI